MGAVIRACMLCDVPELRIVNPGYDDPDRVLVSAPHGDDFFGRSTRVVDDWEPAIEGLDRAFAFTARERADNASRIDLDEACRRIRVDPRPTAFVFGREDKGLPNDIVDRCDAYVVLEASSSFRSFNLAQAVMIAVHRAFVSVRADDALAPDRAHAHARQRHERVDLAALDRAMLECERGLEAIGFFKGDQRDNVLRSIRRVLVRAEPDRRELATFWALFAELTRIGTRDGG